MVTIRFDNGAIATAEANFQAVYGYDVRGEVFGSAGMLTMGGVQESDLVRYLAPGIQADTQRLDTDLLRDAYVAEAQPLCRLPAQRLSPWPAARCASGAGDCARLHRVL